MQQPEEHIQQFIEAEQLELAYQLLLSLDQAEPVQAFMDIVGRSLPNTQEIHTICTGLIGQGFVIGNDPTSILYQWTDRFQIVADYGYIWDFKKHKQAYMAFWLEDIPGAVQQKPKIYDELYIYHPDEIEFLLQRMYEMIELNAPHLLS